MKIQVPVFLYRLYDGADALLYIGITENLGIRMDNHAKAKPWWGHVARLTVDMLPDRPSAEVAEGVAIRTESPRHNVAKQLPAVAGGSPEAVRLFDGQVRRVRDGRSPSKVLAANLRAKVMAGELAADAPLPSIPSYAQQHGHTVSTVQAAWGILKSEGHFYSRNGEGVYVRGWRRCTASTGAALNEHTATVQRVAQVDEVVPPAHIARALKIGEREHVVARHEVLRQGGIPIELSTRYYPLAVAAGGPLAEGKVIHGASLEVLAELGTPVRNIEEIVSGRMPTSAECDALELPAKVPIMRQFRIVYSDSGRPVEATEVIKGAHLHQVSHEVRLPANGQDVQQRVVRRASSASEDLHHP